MKRLAAIALFALVGATGCTCFAPPAPPQQQYPCDTIDNCDPTTTTTDPGVSCQALGCPGSPPVTDCAADPTDPICVIQTQLNP